MLLIIFRAGDSEFEKQIGSYNLALIAILGNYSESLNRSWMTIPNGCRILTIAHMAPPNPRVSESPTLQRKYPWMI